MATPTPKRAHQRPPPAEPVPAAEDEFVLKLRRYMAGTIKGQEAPLSAEIGARTLYIATRLKEILGRIPFVSSADADSAGVQVPLDDGRKLVVELTKDFIEAVTYSELAGVATFEARGDEDLLRRVADLN